MRVSHLAMLVVVSITMFAATTASSDQKPPTQESEAKATAKPWEQWAEANPSWVESFKPFQVIGNIYYVGSRGLSSFLITSDQGHVLIDGGLPQNAEQIVANVQGLGFKVADIEILLNSHAHFDHSGGLAELKQLSGAVLIASEKDKPELESGLYVGTDDPIYSAPGVKVDKTIKDGEVIEIGGIILTANITPGHTPGCTSWSTEVAEDDTSHSVLFFCSASVAGNRLVDPPQYEGIVEDYRKTFKITKDWQPDILLANHPMFFDMESKRSRQEAGDNLAFIDREAFPALMSKLQADFEKKLKEQKLTAQSEKKK